MAGDDVNQTEQRLAHVLRVRWTERLTPSSLQVVASFVSWLAEGQASSIPTPRSNTPEPVDGSVDRRDDWPCAGDP